MIHGILFSLYGNCRDCRDKILALYGTKYKASITLILHTDIKILSYFSNSWGYLKPFYSNTISIKTLQHHGSVLPISTTMYSRFYKLSYDVNIGRNYVCCKQ
jgi:hypothetical protein